MVVFVVSFSGVIVQTGWEHEKREQEHAQIEALINQNMKWILEQQQIGICTSKLSLFIQTMPKGITITWQDIPADYWPCMPKNLTDKR